MKNEAFFSCPNCRADVPRKALACPACGSDEETGWSEEARYMHLLPDRESDALTPRSSTNWVRPVAAILALLSLAGLFAFQGMLGTAIGLSVLLLLAYGAYTFYQRTPISLKLRERQLYTALLEQSRGDHDLVERLIDHERRRHPELTQVDWMQSALDCWKLDRR